MPSTGTSAIRQPWKLVPLLPCYNRPAPAASSYNRPASTASGYNRPTAPSYNRSTPSASNYHRSSSPGQTPRPARPGYGKQNSAAASTQSPKLEPLSDSDRAFLTKHEGCFRCRRTFAGHFWRDCHQGGGDTVKNKGLPKEVKQETNFISEEEEYQY